MVLSLRFRPGIGTICFLGALRNPGLSGQVSALWQAPCPLRAPNLGGQLPQGLIISLFMAL